MKKCPSCGVVLSDENNFCVNCGNSHLNSLPPVPAQQTEAPYQAPPAPQPPARTPNQAPPDPQPPAGTPNQAPPAPQPPAGTSNQAPPVPRPPQTAFPSQVPVAPQGNINPPPYGQQSGYQSRRAPYPPYPPYAPYGYPVPAKYNGLSIAGFITALASIVLLPLGMLISAIGFILSMIGLSQINQRKQRGRGFAIAGISVGASIFGIYLFWEIFLCRFLEYLL